MLGSYLSARYFRPTLTPNEDRTINTKVTSSFINHSAGSPFFGELSMAIIPVIPNNTDAVIKTFVANCWIFFIDKS